MKCPFCDKNSLRVLESRDVNASTLRRRRECTNCENRFTTYEEIEINFKDNDKNFIIYALAGVINYNNQVGKCFKKKKIIVNELKELLEKKPEHYEHIYKNDSLAHGTEFKFNSINKAFINDFIYDDGNHIRIWCTSWGNDLKKAFRWSDELRIKIESKVWAEWLENKSQTASPN